MGKNKFLVLPNLLPEGISILAEGSSNNAL